MSQTARKLSALTSTLTDILPAAVYSAMDEWNTCSYPAGAARGDRVQRAGPLAGPIRLAAYRARVGPGARIGPRTERRGDRGGLQQRPRPGAADRLSSGIP